MNKKRQPVGVQVAFSDDVIDIRAWAKLYVRQVLERRGIAVQSTIPSEQPILAEAS